MLGKKFVSFFSVENWFVASELISTCQKWVLVLALAWGATLGARVGRYQGLHGLILDALLSVRLVTATGDIIPVSATEHSDLFWGLRGAGLNFGIVVSAIKKQWDSRGLFGFENGLPTS